MILAGPALYGFCHQMVLGQASSKEHGIALNCDVSVKLLQNISISGRIFKEIRLCSVLFMSLPLPTIKQTSSENKFPGCLVMELQGILINADKVELQLNLQFNEDWKDITGGRIKFGLRSGELRLKLANATIPLDARELVELFPTSIQKEIQTQASSESQYGIEATFSDSKPGIKGTLGDKRTTGISEKFQITSSQITGKGDSKNPIWVFEPRRDKSVFKTMLKSAKLATADISKLPCCIEAKFVVSLEDICITDGEGIIPKVTRQGDVILKKFLIKKLILPNLEPYLSLVELEYD